jgi:hypothetical protein
MCQTTKFLVPNKCAYFVKPSINEWIIGETNITSNQTSVNYCETWNICEISMRQMAGFLNFSYQTMILLCEIVYEWANHKWNHYNLVPNLNEILRNMKPMCNLDAPNGFPYQTMETVYKRANRKWNEHKLVPNLNETTVKYETYVKPRCTKRFLVRNDAPTLWNHL